jgi:hypothetical protein
MSAVIAVVVQLAGLAGVRLSPFWAGAALAGAIALVLGGCALGAGVHLYNAGYASADGKWREKALEAQLAAARADLDAANRAAGDEALRAASIQQQAEQERAGTDAYVEELKQRAAGACTLTCDDLRGLRIKSNACAAAAGPAGSTSAAPRARWRPVGKPQ